MKRSPFVSVALAGLLLSAAASSSATGSKADHIITEVVLEVGHPADSGGGQEGVLLQPVTLVVYDTLGLSGVERYVQIRQQLRDAYRLDKLSKEGSEMLDLGVGETKLAPSPFPGLKVSLNLRAVDDMQATYEVKLVEAGKDPVTTKVAVQRSAWAVVGGRDGAQAPYFFVLFRPLSQAEEKDERRWEGMTRPKLLKSVQPSYPDEARKAKAQDIIILELKVRADGTVAEATALKGEVPALIAAAREAAMQWEFEPARDASGMPVEVMWKVTLAFKLQ